MSGFFSVFDTQQTVDVGHGYSVVLRQFLTQADFEAAQRALMPEPQFSASQNRAASVASRVDTGAYQRALVLSSIVSWTLDDEAGNPLPVSADTVSKLPNVVFKQLYAAVQKNNEEEDTPEEQASFRGEDSSSDPGSN